MTVGDHIRHRAAGLGLDLSCLDDTELGARLACMPLAVSDDAKAVSTWLVYGTLDGARDGAPAWRPVSARPEG